MSMKNFTSFKETDDMTAVEYAKKYLPELYSTAKNITDDETKLEIILNAFTSDIKNYDDREHLVPNLGINDKEMCARRYRKISGQVCKMGGWANFEHYINNSFVNEAEEYYKLEKQNERLKKLLEDGLNVLGHGHFNVEGYHIQKNWIKKVRNEIGL